MGPMISKEMKYNLHYGEVRKWSKDGTQQKQRVETLGDP